MTLRICKSKLGKEIFEFWFLRSFRKRLMGIQILIFNKEKVNSKLA